MKTFFLLFVILIAHEAFGRPDTSGQEDQQENITTNKRAKSDFQNCNCQCDSYTWSDGTTIKGNCKSQDNNGALFCYVSGRARTACGDVQTSTTVRDNLGNLRTYSYEACTTPPRNQCGQQGQISSLISNNQIGNNQFGNNQFANQNFGDGDLQMIQQGAAGLGSIIGTGVNPNVFGSNQGVVNPGFGQGIIGSGILTGSGFGGIISKTGSGSKGSSDIVSTSGIKTGAA